MAGSDDSGRRPLTLTEKTLIPVGKVGFVIGITIAATLWCARVDSRLGAIESSVSSDTTLSRFEFDAWVTMFKASNPSLLVPNPLNKKPS